jgi:hypothetical protein
VWQWTVRGFRIEEKKAQALARRLQAASARHKTHAGYLHFAISVNYSKYPKTAKSTLIHFNTYFYSIFQYLSGFTYSF